MRQSLKLQTHSDYVKVYVPAVRALIEFSPSRNLDRIWSTLRVYTRDFSWKPEIQYTIPLLAPAYRLPRLCYHPAIFFRHLRLITLRFPQEIFRHAFKKMLWFRHFSLFKKSAQDWNCVTWNPLRCGKSILAMELEMMVLSSGAAVVLLVTATTRTTMWLNYLPIECRRGWSSWNSKLMYSVSSFYSSSMALHPNLCLRLFILPPPGISFLRHSPFPAFQHSLNVPLQSI